MKRFSTLASVAVLAGSLCIVATAGAEEKIRYLDLGSAANRKLLDNLGSGAEGNSLSQLPMGEQTLGGVRFQVGPGLIQLGSQFFDSFPEKVEGIAVNQKLARLHILHATCMGGGTNKQGSPGFVKDGTLIGQYIVHYDDGSSEGVPIIYGEDVRDWWYIDGEPEPSRGKVVWKGDNDYATSIGDHLRLYVSTWANPKPDKTVTKIDYTARKSETPAAPFCISMSVQETK
jgi:hypothetical protein